MNALTATAALATAATPRYDIYRSVHKGLRAALGETLVSVGRHDWGDDERLADTLAQVEELLELIDAHLEHEDQFIHPALERARPGSAARIAVEHVEHRHAIDQLRSAVQTAARTRSGARLTATHQLYHQLALFTAKNLQHLHHEETVLNELLWAHYSDAELGALEGALVASIPPPLMARYLRWMLPAMNTAERAGLLAGIQQGAPAPAFEAALAIAKARLPACEWTRLRLALALPRDA